MATVQQFSLRWNNYLRHVTSVFDDLRSREDLVDVTLCCEGKKIRAHKMLLSACSSYFRDIFKENPCQHPVIIFRNVKFEDLLGIVNFMYHGEVNVAQEQLASFLTTAELLEVQGLTDDSGEKTQENEMKEDLTNKPDQSLKDAPCESNSRKRKAQIEDSENLWVNENKHNFIDSTNTNYNMKLELVEKNEDVRLVGQHDIQCDDIILSTEDVEICEPEILQSSSTLLSELKSPDNNQLESDEVVIPDLTSTDSTLNVAQEDVSIQDLTSESVMNMMQGVSNWKIIELQATDATRESTPPSNVPELIKKLTFDSRLELFDKNNVQVDTACDMCDKVFKHPSSLSHHRKIHKHNIICEICFKAFSRSYNLLRHMKTSHSSL